MTTPAELTLFTVTGHWYDIENTLTSGNTNQPQFEYVSAFVTFTPRIPPGTVLYITNLDLQTTVPPPANLTVTPHTTGGTFTAGQYFWVITALSPSGETTPSNEIGVTLTGATSSTTVAWPQVDGATGYKVYRGTTASNENKLITTINNGATLTYTDTGTAGTTASPPTTPTGESSANTGLVLAPITGRILEGELQVINRADTPNVQLVANTAILCDSTGVPLPVLLYDVAFDKVAYAGAAGKLTNFAFTAPTTAGQTIDLTDPALDRLEYDPTAYPTGA